MVAILTFKKGLDPDNFVIPIESSIADSVTTVALLAAIFLTG
jgi:cation transporter-like permease